MTSYASTSIGASVNEIMTAGATIDDALRWLHRTGHRGTFYVRGPDAIECGSCHHSSAPEDVSLEGLFRIEGESDPADESVVAALLCPSCGKRGTEVFYYGPQAPAEHAAVLGALKDVRRRG